MLYVIQLIQKKMQRNVRKKVIRANYADLQTYFHRIWSNPTNQVSVIWLTETEIPMGPVPILNSPHTHITIAPVSSSTVSYFLNGA